jgi:hypothetical protein
MEQRADLQNTHELPYSIIHIDFEYKAGFELRSYRCHERIEQDEEDTSIHDGRESGMYDIFQTSTHRDVWVRSDMTTYNTTEESMSHTIQFSYKKRSDRPYLFSKQTGSTRRDSARRG